jgi:hypothetical protein
MIIHPPLNEVVNGIIINTNPRLHIPFGEIWSAPFKYGAGGQNLPQYQTNELRLCLKFMVDKDLLHVIGDYDEKTADWNTVVELTEFGEKVRNAGSWIKYNADNSELHRLQVSELKAQKSRFRWTTGLSIALFVVGLYAAYQTDRTRTLEAQLEKATQQKDSLSTEINDRENLLKTKDKEIEEIRQSLTSLRDSLKIRK